MSATHAVAAVAVATALLDREVAAVDEEAAPRGGDGCCGGTRSGTTARHHPQHAAGVAKSERTGKERKGKENGTGLSVLIPESVHQKTKACKKRKSNA